VAVAVMYMFSLIMFAYAGFHCRSFYWKAKTYYYTYGYGYAYIDSGKFGYWSYLREDGSCEGTCEVVICLVEVD
jgi:hypothetical protein